MATEKSSCLACEDSFTTHTELVTHFRNMHTNHPIHIKRLSVEETNQMYYRTLGENILLSREVKKAREEEAEIEMRMRSKTVHRMREALKRLWAILPLHQQCNRSHDD